MGLFKPRRFVSGYHSQSRPEDRHRRMQLFVSLFCLLSVAAVYADPDAQATNSNDESGPNAQAQYQLAYGLNPYSYRYSNTVTDSNMLPYLSYQSSDLTQQQLLLQLQQQQQLLQQHALLANNLTPQQKAILASNLTPQQQMYYAYANLNPSLYSATYNPYLLNGLNRPTYALTSEAYADSMTAAFANQQLQAQRGKREAESEPHHQYASYSTYGYPKSYSYYNRRYPTPTYTAYAKYATPYSPYSPYSHVQPEPVVYSGNYLHSQVRPYVW